MVYFIQIIAHLINMKIEPIKQFFLSFFKPVALFWGIIGTTVTIAIALSDIEKWVFAFIAIILFIFSSFLIYLYVKKSELYREQEIKLHNTISIFDKTHNTWHLFKRLTDKIHLGNNDIEKIEPIIHSDILKLVTNFKDALELFHPNIDFNISIKAYSYKNIDELDESDVSSYINLPFVLRDLPLYRETSESPLLENQIIDKLDFDENTNKGGMDNLKQTLFYKAFETRTVIFVDKFSEIQQQYTDRYNSGLCVPVILLGIPFAVICVGTSEINIFKRNIHDFT